MSPEDRELQIQTIETHLRRLGLTEAQICLHVAPLKAKAEKPQLKRKAGRSNSMITYFIRPSRKPLVIS
jgi:hypothetical protein